MQDIWSLSQTKRLSLSYPSVHRSTFDEWKAVGLLPRILTKSCPPETRKNSKKRRMKWNGLNGYITKKFPFFYLVSIPMNAKSIVNWCYRVFQLDWTISKAPLCIIQNLLVHPVFYLETSTIIVTFLDHECFSLTVKGSRHAMAFLDFKDWTHVECNPTFLVQKLSCLVKIFAKHFRLLAFH